MSHLNRRLNIVKVPDWYQHRRMLDNIRMSRKAGTSFLETRAKRRKVRRSALKDTKMRVSWQLA